MDVDVNVSRVRCQLKASVAVAREGSCAVHTRHAEGILVTRGR